MRIIPVFILLSIIMLSSQCAVYAQEGDQFDPIKDDISNKIPPLEMLIDSAIVHNPYVQFRDLQVIVNACKLRAKQVEWTRNIGFQANTGYGNLYNYTSTATDGINPVPASTKSQRQYSASVYINLPLNTIADRKNQVKLANAEIDQAQKMAEVQRNELRQTVIKLYNDLILKQRLNRIKAKYLETSRINMQMVEKEFANGIISVTEYARISETVTRTESDFENSRMDFLTAYMILEAVVGMEFNLTNDISETHEAN